MSLSKCSWFTPWRQDVSWKYIRRSEGTQNVFSISYVCSVYFLCPEATDSGIWIKQFSLFSGSAELVWSIMQFADQLFLSVFDHFVKSVLKGLRYWNEMVYTEMVYHCYRQYSFYSAYQSLGKDGLINSAFDIEEEESRLPTRSTSSKRSNNFFWQIFILKVIFKILCSSFYRFYSSKKILF